MQIPDWKIRKTWIPEKIAVKHGFTVEVVDRMANNEDPEFLNSKLLKTEVKYPRSRQVGVLLYKLIGT